MRFALIPAALAAALAVSPALGQAQQQPQPGLSNDQVKPQQNTADEAGVRGRLEDATKPGDPSTQVEANKKVEDAAVAAKQKSDAKGSSGAATPR